MAARLIAATSIWPLAAARKGPILSGPSPPRSKSLASLNKLVAIWIQAAPSMATSAARIFILPATAQARVAPTSTGASAMVKVRGRIAPIQAEKLDGRAAALLTVIHGFLCSRPDRGFFLLEAR